MNCSELYLKTIQRLSRHQVVYAIIIRTVFNIFTLFPLDFQHIFKQKTRFTCCNASSFGWKSHLARSALASLFLHIVRDISILRMYFIPLTICDKENKQGSMGSVMLLLVYFTPEDLYKRQIGGLTCLCALSMAEALKKKASLDLLLKEQVAVRTAI